MHDTYDEKNLSLFVEGAIKLGLTLKECEKALIIKGWSKGFVDKYCSKYYKIHRGNMRKEKAESAEESREYAKEHVIEDQIEKINRELMKMR